MNGMSMKAFAAKVKSKVGGKSKSGKGASKRDLLPLELSLGTSCCVRLVRPLHALPVVPRLLTAGALAWPLLPGPHKLALPKGSEKGWRSEASDFKETEENSGRLQGEVGQLRSQIEALEKELVDAKEEKYLAEFKSKLLVEMVRPAPTPSSTPSPLSLLLPGGGGRLCTSALFLVP